MEKVKDKARFILNPKFSSVLSQSSRNQFKNFICFSVYSSWNVIDSRDSNHPSRNEDQKQKSAEQMSSWRHDYDVSGPKYDSGLSGELPRSHISHRTHTRAVCYFFTSLFLN